MQQLKVRCGRKIPSFNIGGEILKADLLLPAGKRYLLPGIAYFSQCSSITMNIKES